MEETNVVLPPIQEQPKSSKKVLVVLVMIIALVVGGIYMFKQSRGSDTGEFSEIDRVVAASVDLYCLSLNPLPKSEEPVTFGDYNGGFDSSLKPRVEDLIAQKEILKKYGFENEMDYETVGAKYKNTEEFTNKVIMSPKYTECTNAVLSVREDAGLLYNKRI